MYFDVVLAMDVIEHVEDYYGFLRKLQVKGEFKVFRIPLDISALGVAQSCRHILTERETVGHIHYFTKDLALAALEDTGYEVIDFFYTPLITYLRGGSLKTKMKRFPVDMGSFVILAHGYLMMHLNSCSNGKNS